MYPTEKKADKQKVIIATVPLGAYTTISTFLPRSEALLEIILCQRLQHLLLFGMYLLYGVKSSPRHLNFYLGKEEEDITLG